MSSEDFAAECSKDNYGIKNANKVLIAQNLTAIGAPVSHHLKYLGHE